MNRKQQPEKNPPASDCFSESVRHFETFHLTAEFVFHQWWPIQPSRCRSVTRTTWRMFAPSSTVDTLTTTLSSIYHSATTAAPNSPTGWVHGCPPPPESYKWGAAECPRERTRRSGRRCVCVSDCGQMMGDISAWFYCVWHEIRLPPSPCGEGSCPTSSSLRSPPPVLTRWE